MRTRIVHKRVNKRIKVFAWIGTIVILAGVGAGSYIYKPWEQKWFTAIEIKTVAAEAKKEPTSTPAPIQNVSVVEVTPIIQVKGSKKLDPLAVSFFGKINKIELQPQKQFSYNEWFGKVKDQLESAPKEDIYSYLAALLYEATVKSGFQVGERHLHQLLPSYTAPGFDVFVTPASNGLTLYNPKEFSVVVSISYSDDFPILTLSTDPKAAWKSDESQIKMTKYAPEKVEIADQSLAKGSQITKIPGKEGLLLEVSIGGQLLSKDFYLPIPTVIASGPVPVEVQSDEIKPISG